jgi:uncharacterized protein involved in cysteine biosynthesis|tara:strand:- start:483 stop:737 length:255 start_codon:yes stop_codon:yes gene_type:complete
MVLGNVSEFILNFPPELIGKIGFLIAILQALGGVIIIYLVFSIINTIINRKRNKKIDEVLEGINNINKNLREIKGILIKNKKKI